MIVYFLKREVSDRFIGNSSAFFWLLFQPLATLAVYYFVFGLIFKARVPELPENMFVAYLSAGLWPWMAFSESVMSAAQLVINKKDLIGKVKIDIKILLYAHITASFLLQVIGFVAVITVLILAGIIDLHWKLLFLIFPLALLFLMAIVLGLFLSSFQVFNRDVKNIIAAVFPLWFFMTPIIYSVSRLPDGLTSWLPYNPLFIVVDFSQKIIVNQGDLLWQSLLIWFLVAGVLLKLALMFFNKTSPVFDDYL
ncbi:ABC transporter permease [Marinicella rhabdoformis]|uniref:ABC transporter permease n=1 Tax=Marinicella rhabdoformis TaxID=2580566 RepID=UPI0012AEB927|nr:ABC transporter permease [Marinicella rhabdoformis]